MDLGYRDGHPEDLPWDAAFVVRDVQRKPWWPYRPIDGVVDSLWLHGIEGTPGGKFGKLVEGWGAALDWFAVGSGAYIPGTEPTSWTKSRNLSETKLLGKLTYEDSSRFGRSMEWRQLAPNPEDLYALLSGPLLHPWGGWWMAASADADAGGRFVRATTGLLWWSRRLYQPYDSPAHMVVDHSVIEALLGLLPQIGLISLVPLNNHPVSGIVLFAVREMIQAAVDSLGGVPESEGKEVTRMLQRATWLAC